MQKKIRELIIKILEFTTGLGFYGIGLLAGAFVTLFVGWPLVSAGLVGAFIHKNYAAIVQHLKDLTK